MKELCIYIIFGVVLIVFVLSVCFTDKKGDEEESKREAERQKLIRRQDRDIFLDGED